MLRSVGNQNKIHPHLSKQRCQNRSMQISACRNKFVTDANKGCYRLQPFIWCNLLTLKYRQPVEREFCRTTKVNESEFLKDKGRQRVLPKLNQISRLKICKKDNKKKRKLSLNYFKGSKQGSLSRRLCIMQQLKYCTLFVIYCSTEDNKNQLHFHSSSPDKNQHCSAAATQQEVRRILRLKIMQFLGKVKVGRPNMYMRVHMLNGRIFNKFLCVWLLNYSKVTAKLLFCTFVHKMSHYG